MGLFGSKEPNIMKMFEKGDVNGLTRAIKHKNGLIRGAAIDALALLSPHHIKALIEPLLEALNDSEEKVRAAAAYALRFGGKKAIKPLINAGFLDRSGHVRSNATAALRVIGAPALLAIKKQLTITLYALLDPNIDVRKGAVKALKNIKWKPANEVEKVRFKIASERWNDLVKIGEPSVETLISIMGNQYEDMLRKKATQALTQIGNPAVELLKEALQDKDKYIRGNSACVLGNIGEISAIEPLGKLLNDKNIWVRDTAKDALGKLKNK